MPVFFLLIGTRQMTKLARNAEHVFKHFIICHSSDLFLLWGFEGQHLAAVNENRAVYVN